MSSSFDCSLPILFAHTGHYKPETGGEPRFILLVSMVDVGMQLYNTHCRSGYAAL
jgi:hypothetical protein